MQHDHYLRTGPREVDKAGEEVAASSAFSIGGQALYRIRCDLRNPNDLRGALNLAVVPIDLVDKVRAR